jgi:hypothetical protein
MLNSVRRMSVTLDTCRELGMTGQEVCRRHGTSMSVKGCCTTWGGSFRGEVYGDRVDRLCAGSHDS